MSEKFQQAYQRYIDLCHVIDQDAVDYATFLEGVIEDIRVMAEPLAYAIRENPPREIDDQTIIEVDKGRGSMDWLEGEPEIPLTVGYLKVLLYNIYDDFPEVKLPNYDD